MSHHVADPKFEWPTIYIQIVPRLAGSLSAVSSATIIYLIFRSQARASSIYHQIILCMSIFDIMGSLAMALTTIPMPREMPQEKELGFDWPGGRYGNHATCAAQGFFALFGTIATMAFNAMLCLYYACAVAFQMKEKTIRRYILPIIYGLPIVSGFGFAITVLFTDSFNPPTDFTFGYWCVPTVYPSFCTEEDGTCLRGDIDVIEKATVVLFFAISLGVLIMVTSLVLVVHSLYRARRITEKFVKATEHNGASVRFSLYSHTDKLERVQKDTRVIVLQSAAYIVAFISGAMWALLSSDGKINSTTFKFGLFFVPLQGFLNLFVYLSHKIHNYRRIYRHSTVCEVAKLLFTTQVQEPCFVSRISMVADDGIQARNGDGLISRLRIMNEMDVEERMTTAGMRKSGETRKAEPDHNIEDVEEDRSESFVDDQRQSTNCSRDECKQSSRVYDVSSISSSFQVSGSSSLDINDENYGMKRQSNMEYMKTRGVAVQELAAKTNIEYGSSQKEFNTKGDASLGYLSEGDLSRFSGLSGFSSLLRSAASFGTSVTPGLRGKKGSTKDDEDARG